MCTAPKVFWLLILSFSLYSTDIADSFPRIPLLSYYSGWPTLVKLIWLLVAHRVGFNFLCRVNTKGRVGVYVCDAIWVRTSDTGCVAVLYWPCSWHTITTSWFFQVWMNTMYNIFIVDSELHKNKVPCTSFSYLMVVGTFSSLSFSFC